MSHPHPQPSECAIALFTRDLRVHDNPVLHAASQARVVVPLFVLDEAIAASGFLAPNRARFLLQSLTALDQQLQERGGELVLRRGGLVQQVLELARQHDAAEVHIAEDVSSFAHRRAESLRSALHADGRELVIHEASVTVAPPGAVTPTGNDHFAVFTPYHRHWAQLPRRRALPAPDSIRVPTIAPGAVPDAEELCTGQPSPNLADGGEPAARALLQQWESSVADYAAAADDLSRDGSSRLSPYLHFGCLSPTELVERVGTGSEGAAAFVRQVAWRDFHHQVLAARPASSHRNYRDKGDRWREDPQALRAWQEGRTGYPIVDAGMRQLAREGWMHNRARLITGSFLTKTLYLDWRHGAEHFLRLLLDGDVANNQLNWQWVAGTGTDTRPNRVLNPLAQAKRYDPNGDYVRRYVPELAGISAGHVHQPWRLTGADRQALDYPDPIVDLDEARRRFLDARGK